MPKLTRKEFDDGDYVEANFFRRSKEIDTRYATENGSSNRAVKVNAPETIMRRR